MKCIADGCNADAVGMSNYCSLHRKTKSTPRPGKMAIAFYSVAKKAVAKPAAKKAVAKPAAKKVT